MSNAQPIDFCRQIDPGDVRSGKRGGGVPALAAARAGGILMTAARPSG